MKFIGFLWIVLLQLHILAQLSANSLLHHFTFYSTIDLTLFSILYAFIKLLELPLLWQHSSTRLLSKTLAVVGIIACLAMIGLGCYNNWLCIQVLYRQIALWQEYQNILLLKKIAYNCFIFLINLAVIGSYAGFIILPLKRLIKNNID